MPLTPEHLSAEDAQSDLQNSNSDLMNLLLEFKDYSIVMLDAAGYIISWNEGAERLYGYTPEEMLGKYESVLYTLTDVKNGRSERNLALAAQAGRYEFEILKRKKNGAEFFTNTIINTSYNSDKTVKGFVKITRDIDFQKKLEAINKTLNDELAQKAKQRTKDLLLLNSELEAFSYSVSHDLRSPLRAIGGYSNMLKKKFNSVLGNDGTRMINVIVDKAKLMSLLIDDLLTFSKMARLEIVSDAINMKQMAESCLSDLLQTETFTTCNIHINNMPACNGDAGMLKQVWFNLLSNAIKYSSKKARPEIIAGSVEDSEMNIYYVRDNGAGFDMKYAANLFGVFQRLHRQDEFEGVGLGLALVKRIVTKHGGEIWAESVLNEGAAFYFSIPKALHHYEQQLR